jgi:signal transduction histidine kinase
VDRGLRECFETGEPRPLEYVFLLPGGTPKQCKTIAHAIRDETGTIVKLMGTVMDVTERKQTEEELRRSEALLSMEKRLLEMAAKGEPLPAILTTTCLLVEQLCRDALCSIQLLDSEAGRLWNGASPSLPPAYTKAIDGIVIGPAVGSCGTSAYQGRQVIVTDIASDPLWKDYHGIASANGLGACWSTPIFSQQNKILGTFAIYSQEPRSPTFEDREVIQHITHLMSVVIERKRVEEALRRAQVNLAHMTRLTTMGELTASIAHEVNQPLAAVVTNANACLRWLEREIPDLDEAREAIRRIIRDGNRGSEVIARIRALLRKEPPTRVPLPINEVVREVIPLAQADLQGIILHLDLTEGLPPVSADRVQLQQVLFNLTINAIEAMKPVKNRPRVLKIQTQAHEQQTVLVTVQDSGIGINPERMPQLFDAFFTTKSEGLGLGLSISRSIIEGYGGRLWAESSEGVGTTFLFTLPLENGGSQ